MMVYVDRDELWPDYIIKDKEESYATVRVFIPEDIVNKYVEARLNYLKIKDEIEYYYDDEKNNRGN